MGAKITIRCKLDDLLRVIKQQSDIEPIITYREAEGLVNTLLAVFNCHHTYTYSCSVHLSDVTITLSSKHYNNVVGFEALDIQERQAAIDRVFVQEVKKLQQHLTPQD